MSARAISVLLAFILTITLIPSTSLAFADEATQGSEASAAQTAEDAASPDAADAATDESALETEEATTSDVASFSQQVAAQDRVNEQKPLVASNASVLAGATSDTEIISQSVQLAATPQTLLTYNGLTYRVNADDSQTVSCVGVADKALSGTVEIPGQVKAAGATYAVTNISSNTELGGGVRASA